jgi:hypothetical protein
VFTEEKAMTSYADRLIDAVAVLDFEGEPCREFENGAFAILAMALALLPETQRERYLSDIERGDLRAAVAQILRPPYPPVAPGRLQ